MKTRKTTKLTVAAIFAAAAVFMSADATALAQGVPPAEGPPAATPNAKSFPTSIFDGQVSDALNKGIAAAVAKGVNVSGTWASQGPYMTQTQFRDRPNQFIVTVPYLLTYNVTKDGNWITITQSVQVGVACQGWQNGLGEITAEAQSFRPYFDRNQSVTLTADILVLPDVLNANVQAGLANIPWGTGSTTQITPCSTLGVATRAQGFPWDSIEHDIYPLSPVRLGPPSTIPTGIIVRVLQVRRLPLEDRGAPVYNLVETPGLQLWANNSVTSLVLPPMMEGQTFVPTTYTGVQTPIPANGQLVLIANMVYQGLPQEDSTYAVFDSSSNYGSGTQKLAMPKTWTDFTPVLRPGTKPIVVSMIGEGYEVTLGISVGWPNVLAP